MKEALRDLLRSVTMPLTLIIWVLVSITSAIAGPFGTYANMAILPRSIYWTAVAALAIIVGYGARFLAAYLIGVKKPALVDALSAVLTVLFLTPLLWLMTMQIPYLDMRDVPSLGRFVFYVMLITILIIVLRRVVMGADGKTFYEARLAEIAGGPTLDCSIPRLAKRLDRSNSSPILRLTVRDHLVDVVSEQTTETLRMRFADAIEEMEPVAGYSTHRSHWVCRDAISDVVYEPGGKVFLNLHNGDTVPVSRKYRPVLEDAGIV